MPDFTGEMTPHSFLRKCTHQWGFGFSFGTATFPSDDDDDVQSLCCFSQWQMAPQNGTALGILTTCKPALPRRLWAGTKSPSCLGRPKCAHKQVAQHCHCVTLAALSSCSLCTTISSPKICSHLYVAALWPWLWAWTMNSRLWIQTLQSSQLITSCRHQTNPFGTRQNLGKYFKQLFPRNKL